MKVFIERQGRRRELSGWRKWAIAIPGIAIAALVGAFAALLVFGLALTIGAVLLVALPIALVLLFIALMFGRYEVRENAD